MASTIMDAQYTVLARRFRPQTFSEVVGQEAISQTLRNAIHEGRVAHAYLFTGARGVGKTSMARIFAKALNCPNSTEDGVPCNECEICTAISVGQDVDVSEIDGASNRGIDDIRMLRANVGVKSMRSKYKIYIIDEVHMLTKEAFNALLKTLEEPPPRVKFIFCTTEPNKVPDTILSRCQRFDFGTISVDNISNRLSQLAIAEGFQVEPAALELVARRAAGSMRDSQSIFDQLLAFGAKTIAAADVHRLLGTAPDDRIIQLMDDLIARDQAGALGRLDNSLHEGVQLEALTDQLVAYLRDLMVLACGATEASLFSVGTDQRPRLQEQASRWGLQTIVAAMQIMADTKGRMQRATYGRALAELALVRISMLEDLGMLDTLISQLRTGLPLASAPPVASRVEKKNDLAEIKGNRSDQAVTDQSVSEPESTAAQTDIVPVIHWKPGCEKELHAAILSRLTGMSGTYLSRVAKCAISGPSQLDFSFTPKYDLDRKQCDRPEVVSRIEQIVGELTGTRVRVRFLVSDDAPPEAVKVTSVAVNTSVKYRVVDEPEDPYLLQLMGVFQVQGWRIQPQVPEPGRTLGAEEA
jgi:DNA polymerase-3 subunit gamma/tau